MLSHWNTGSKQNWWFFNVFSIIIFCTFFSFQILQTAEKWNCTVYEWEVYITLPSTLHCEKIGRNFVQHFAQSWRSIHLSQKLVKFELTPSNTWIYLHVRSTNGHLHYQTNMHYSFIIFWSFYYQMLGI